MGTAPTPPEDRARPQQKPAARPAEKFRIATERAGGCVFARLSGRLSINEFLSTLHILGVESEGWPETVMLIDLRGLSSSIYPPADLLRIGQEIACSFTHMRRLALLVRPERVTRISERSARSTGMDMGVFDTEVRALEWLARRKEGI